MNATQLAMSTYATAAPSTAAILTPRDIEYRAFARVTRGLQEAKLAGHMPAVAEAMYENTRLWTTLAAEVLDSRSQLPETLRAQIVNLSRFSQVHAGKVLRGAGGVDVLIDVNLAVMRGLQPTREKSI